MLVLLFAGNIFLLITLIEKHNAFTEQHHTSLVGPEGAANAPMEVKREVTVATNTIKNYNPNDVTSLLWSDMTKSQQIEAYNLVEPFLKKQADLVKNRQNQGKGNHGNPSFDWSCQSGSIGRGWGGHHMCLDLLEKMTTCEFLSFGIAGDYSFEKKLSDVYHCHGYAADPTVSYPTNIHKNVTFHQVGANILNANMELKNNGDEEWWITSVPQLRKALGLGHFNILKMDCEGCEYALARDIVRDDPSFFEHVDQFVVEVHLAREWLNSTETLYYYGMLLKKLDDAGLRAHDVRALGCAPEHTKTGCIADYLCKDSNRCHNYLFARA